MKIKIKINSKNHNLTNHSNTYLKIQLSKHHFLNVMFFSVFLLKNTQTYAVNGETF